MENVKIALVGNPNVGKSTVFNHLTGLHQHTGNWPGKTVTSSFGSFSYHEKEFTIYDLPGTYSLVAHSKEEEVTRDFICMEEYDLSLVVCDAVSLERNLNLALQVMDVSPNSILAINLVDEAKKKGIMIDYHKLSKELGVPVLGISARSGWHMEDLKEVIYEMTLAKKDKNVTLMCEKNGRLETEKYLKRAEKLAKDAVVYTKKDYLKRDLKLDQIFTSKYTRNPYHASSTFVCFLAYHQIFQLSVKSFIYRIFLAGKKAVFSIRNYTCTTIFDRRLAFTACIKC